MFFVSLVYPKYCQCCKKDENQRIQRLKTLKTIINELDLLKPVTIQRSVRKTFLLLFETKSIEKTPNPSNIK